MNATAARIALLLVTAMSAHSARCAVDLSAIARLTSNYEYRGYTLSDNHAAAQANVDAAWTNGVFLGSWLSSADFGGATAAANPYLGKSFTLSPDWRCIALVAGHLFYGKINKYKTRYGEYDMADDYNASYGEAALQFAYRDIGSVHVSVSPDYYGSSETVVDYEAELRYPLWDNVELSGGLGYQASRDALNHDDLYGDIGIAWFVLPHLTLDIRYHDVHAMNERRYGGYENDPSAAYRLDTPVIFSISVGI